MVLVTKSKHHHKQAPGDRQRQGKHHKHSDPYMKTYWPYLPLALLVVGGLLFSSLWGHAHKNVLGYATDISINELLQDTNDQRSANGLGGLSLNEKLDNAAQAKANDMAARNYWAHNTPEGNPPWVFITNAGYSYQTAGENLAYGFDSSGNAVAGWMASPGHKANILNTTYTEVGFGFANASDYQGTGPETIIVAEYASPQVLSYNAPAPAQPASTPSSSTPAAAPTASEPAPSDTPAAAPTSTPAADLNATPLANNSQTASAKPIETQNISRIQLLANNKTVWSSFAISALAGVCICLFLLRHALFWHRTLVKGEKFFIHHKLLDLGLVLVAVVGFVLTRSAGVIH